VLNEATDAGLLTSEQRLALLLIQAFLLTGRISKWPLLTVLLARVVGVNRGLPLAIVALLVAGERLGCNHGGV